MYVFGSSLISSGLSASDLCLCQKSGGLLLLALFGVFSDSCGSAVTRFSVTDPVSHIMMVMLSCLSASTLLAFSGWEVSVSDELLSSG